MGLLDGLLGDSWEDPKSQAIMGLAQGLLSARGSQGLALGVGKMNEVMAGAREKELQRAYLQAKIDETRAQADERASLANREKAALLLAQRKQDALPGLYGMSGGGATNLVNEALPPDLRIGALPSLPGNSPDAFNVQAALRAGFSPDEISKLAALRNVNRDKVAARVDGVDERGRPVTFQMDDYGNKVGPAIGQWKQPMTISQGDRTTLVDPVSQMAGASFSTFQSPDSVASGKVTMRGQDMVNARARETLAQAERPVWIESLQGFANPRTQQVLPTRDALGRVVESAGPKLTEDQAKAAGWLVQAGNAYGNMQGAVKRDPQSMNPTLRETIAQLPYIGGGEGVANAMRSPDRQTFVQGASSLSEALLRAATGAGVNRDEAIQKITELTPQYSDSDLVKKQKMEAIPLFIKSLELRAGPGAKGANSILGGSSGGANTSWSIERTN